MTLNFNTNKTYIIAEAGVNHNGKYQIAKKLVYEAARCGANAIKFQIFSASNLSTKSAKLADYQKKNIKKKMSQQLMLRKLELKYQDYLNLKSYAKKCKIDFLVSVFDEKSLNFYEKKLQNNLLKIPSGEITNYFLLKKLNLKKYKIILSTGMSNLKEIAEAINLIANSKVYKCNSKITIENRKKFREIKNKLFLLHCVSDYPAKIEYLNLKTIETMKKNFGLKIGFSDHSKSILSSSIAVAAGAEIIEKHFTLNKKMIGPDHSSSMDLKEFKTFVKMIHETEVMLGSKLKKPQKCEFSNMKNVRKSLVPIKDIKIGKKILIDNLTAKRPGLGLSPMELKKILNKKAKKNFPKDKVIKL